MNQKEKILAKIQALHKKAESLEQVGNFDEASTFAAHVSRLMLKYNIELHELATEDELSINHEEFHFAPYWKRNESHWLFTLMGVVARANMSKLMGYGVRGGAKRPYYTLIYGEQQNIETVKTLFSSLHHQIRHLEKVAWKEYVGPDKRNTFFRSYHIGLTIGLQDRFNKMKEEIREEHGESGLIFIGNAMKKVSEEVDKRHPSAGTVKSRGSKSHAGFSNGMNDANKLSINKGTITNGIKSKRLN